jgi:uncharacterized protein YceH (UPF0502 family)
MERNVNLSTEEARVLGCLIEKELTTPDYYPLTMNALVTACNQSSNREPVVEFDEGTVHTAMQGLRAKELARSVKAVKSRALKHRHDLDTTLRLDVPERSVLAIMLLRGPQTVGELRTRTDRYHEFESLEAVEAALRNLSAETPRLAERLERRPGQKEARWRQLLCDAQTQAPVVMAPTHTPEDHTDLAALIAELTARVDRLERELGVSDD